jgi:hypothetical protein
MLHLRCRSGKRKFYDFVSADVRAKQYSKILKERINAYLCKFCDWYHVGHVYDRAIRMRKYSVGLSTIVTQTRRRGKRR